MFKYHFLANDENKKSLFKKYANKLTKIKTLSKRNYYISKIKEDQDNPRKVWNTIRSVLPQKSSHGHENSSAIKLDGHETTDPQIIADHFNKFFCSIGSNLAQNCPNTELNSHLKYLSHRISSSIFLDIPSYAEISNVINSLSMNKAVGHDNIPSYFLRIASTILVPYLHIFIEFSFTNGLFPTNCVVAKVVPIFKKGDRKNPTDYRPISILSCFSKILEKLTYTRLINFLYKHEIIEKTQYGFRRNSSTNHALIDVVTTSMDNISNRLFTGLIFVDLIKAFDTVCHKILLTKLDHYGIRGTANDLISSFLMRK